MIIHITHNTLIKPLLFIEQITIHLVVIINIYINYNINYQLKSKDILFTLLLFNFSLNLKFVYILYYIIH